MQHGCRLDGRRLRVGVSVAYSAMTRHEFEFGTFRPQLNTLLMAVLLVLVAAAANTTGLLLVRASGRRRDIAGRSALGAAPAERLGSPAGDSLALRNCDAAPEQSDISGCASTSFTANLLKVGLEKSILSAVRRVPTV